MTDDFRKRMEGYLPDDTRKELVSDDDKIKTFKEETKKEKQLLEDNHLRVVDSRWFALIKFLAVLFIIVVAVVGTGYLYLVNEGHLQTVLNMTCGSLSNSNSTCTNQCTLICNSSYNPSPTYVNVSITINNQNNLTQ